jgi:predicted transcriptional regulator
MASTAEQIITNVAKGLSQVQVAKMLGVDESYVSQVVNSEDGQAAIAELASQISEVNEKFDTVLEETEMLALDRIKNRTGMANLQQSLAIFKTLNAAKRRRDTSPATRQTVGEVQVLVLPQIAVTNYVMNSNSEIIEVEGRTMISADAKKLPQMMLERLGRKIEERNVQLSDEKVSRAQELLTGMQGKRPARKLAAELDITDLL